MAGSDTPLMQQWREVKARHTDCMVFFRVGDFYELFYEDAEEGARILGITLTSRNNGSSRAPLAGVPVHALDQYLQKLVKAGKRVAICDQVEDAAEAKGLVRREVTETITPGTVLSDNLLDGRRHNFLVALSGDAEAGGSVGIAAADLSTGELVAMTTSWSELPDHLGAIEPSELLLPKSWELFAREQFSAPTTFRGDWLFEAGHADEELKRQYQVQGSEGFGLSPDSPATGAVGAAVAYLNETQPQVSAALRPPRVLSLSNSMVLDEMTRRNLELVEPLNPGPDSRTLLDVVDRSLTPMGARMMRQWILSPLLSADQIRRRLDAVTVLFEEEGLRRSLRAALREIRDLERLAVKIAAGRINPRELDSVRTSVERIPEIRALLDKPDGLLGEIHENLDPLDDLCDLVAAALVDDPPVAIGEGGIIRTGFDPELDDLREVHEGAVDWIARHQATERERTGISSLKVGFNKVFGYYLEVTRTHLERVPEDYQRRQTLTNAERYITPELKEWEEKVLGAEDKLLSLEARLFDDLRRRSADFTPRIHALAEAVARLDVLASLAETARRQEYIRPEIADDFALEIRGGRHPVVETMMPREEFIPNDVTLSREARVVILTGPNMAGKSTILRQVGLITLLAQIGSYVPAADARVGVCDRIFTRVGASDNLVRGRSTFMMEMTETAAILNGATERSLVLLDEIGRGTSTWDGLSVATAVTEHLHDHVAAKTIFATHYHELTQLDQRLDAVANFSVAVRESGDTIVFVRSLVAGGADRSYGVEVARLAGLPPEVIKRARALLVGLEKQKPAVGRPPSPASLPDPGQLGLFPAAEHAVVDRLRKIDPDTMTPLQALALLAELKSEAEA